MAKRARVSGRPTSRPRPARPLGGASGATKPSAANSSKAPASLTEEEAQRAAELEAALVAQEKSAASARIAAQAARARRAGGGRDIDPELLNQPLSVRAAHEYAYVARDVRRIGLTAGLMLAILLTLAFAINVGGLIKF